MTDTRWAVFSQMTQGWVAWRFDESSEARAEGISGLLDLMMVAGQDLECAERVFTGHQQRFAAEMSEWRAVRGYWANQDLPASDLPRPPHPAREAILAARTYVLAMWHLKSAVWMLSKTDLLGKRPGVAAALELLTTRFPELLGMRDSLAHPEDRYRGRVSRPGKPVEHMNLVIHDSIHEPDTYVTSIGAEQVAGIAVNDTSTEAAAVAASMVLEEAPMRPFLSGRPAWPPNEVVLSQGCASHLVSPWWDAPRDMNGNPLA